MPIDLDDCGNPIGSPYVGTDGVKRDRHGNPIPLLANVNDTDVITPLNLDGGAALIGTAEGTNVQEEIDNLQADISKVGLGPSTKSEYTVTGTIDIADNGRLITCTSIELTMPDPTDPDFGNSWSAWIVCAAGPAIINPSAGKTLNGAANITLTTGQGIAVSWVENNWYVLSDKT